MSKNSSNNKLSKFLMNRKEAVLFQVLSGIIVSVVFSFIDLFIVENIMDLTIYNYWSLFEFAFIVGLSFYLLQSTILNWIGMQGWLILILIWLFGMPAVNLPVQFLNNFTKYAVYSWSPYRFSSEIFRDIMYYNSKADFSSMASIIIISGLVFFILLMLSMFKVNKNMNSDDRNEVSSEVY